MSELHRVERCYARDGRLVDLLGGLRGAITRLDALLAHYAPGAPAVAPEIATVAETGSPACLDAMLGAIAIRDRLASLIQPAALPEPEPPGSARVLESLLR